MQLRRKGMNAELIARRLHKPFPVVWKEIVKHRDQYRLFMCCHDLKPTKVPIAFEYTVNKYAKTRIKKKRKLKKWRSKIYQGKEEVGSIHTARLKRVLTLRRNGAHIEEVMWVTGISVERLYLIFEDYGLDEMPINLLHNEGIPWDKSEEEYAHHAILGYYLDGTDKKWDDTPIGTAWNSIL